MPSRTKKRSVPTEKRCFGFSADQAKELESARKALSAELNLNLTDTDTVHLCIGRQNALMAAQREAGKATERA